MFGFLKKKKSPFLSEDEYDKSTNDGGLCVHVQRTEYRPFYDSTWDVTMTNAAGKSENVSIVLEDIETADDVLNLVIMWFWKLGTLSAVKKQIDMRNSIYYD